MTQPNTIDMTFDTSLIDVKPANTSFSTTESYHSSETDAFKRPSSTTPNTPTHEQLSSTMPPPKSSTPVQHIPTQLAYDQWASVYDTDGNMLQAIDDVELSTLLPTFLGCLTSTIKSSTKSSSLSVLDLGCGTGRNTLKLVSHAWPQKNGAVSITGLDFSRAMLDVAAGKLRKEKGEVDVSVRLLCCDCFPTVSTPSASPLPAVDGLQPQHGVISTLVLEHIPLNSFFATLSSLLLPGGRALVTNMHADMGRRSQAGFVNAEGVKVRGSSFVYTVEETIEAAEEAGFKLVNVREREMQLGDVESGAVGQRGRKWVGTNVWYAVVLSKIG